MTITNGYVTLSDLDARLGIDDARDASLRERAIQSASRAIDGYCGRFFYAQTSATVQLFAPGSDLVSCNVDDISTTTGLTIKTGLGGSYTQTLASTDYELEPINGVGPSGEPWPYTTIRRLNTWWLFSYGPLTRYTIQVTAKWGWPAVPDPVEEACLMLAADLYHMKEQRFGIAGWNEFGPLRVRSFVASMAADMLAIYRGNQSSMAGIA